MGELKISYRLEVGDYINFVWLAYPKQFIVNYVLTMLVILFVILCGNWLAIIILIAIVAANELHRIHTYKAQFRTNTLLQKEKAVTFVEHVVDIAYVDGTNGLRMTWDNFVGAKKSKNIIVLFSGDGAGLIIPKRFLSNEQIAALEGLITAKLQLRRSRKII